MVWGRVAAVCGGQSRYAALFEWIDAGKRGGGGRREEGEDGLRSEECSSFMFDLLFRLYHICEVFVPATLSERLIDWKESKQQTNDYKTL